jgi:hypothetical protein
LVFKIFTQAAYCFANYFPFSQNLNFLIKAFFTRGGMREKLTFKSVPEIDTKTVKMWILISFPSWFNFHFSHSFRLLMFVQWEMHDTHHNVWHYISLKHMFHGCFSFFSWYVRDEIFQPQDLNLKHERRECRKKKFFTHKQLESPREKIKL